MQMTVECKENFIAIVNCASLWNDAQEKLLTILANTKENEAVINQIRLLFFAPNSTKMLNKSAFVYQIGQMVKWMIECDRP